MKFIHFSGRIFNVDDVKNIQLDSTGSDNEYSLYLTTYDDMVYCEDFEFFKDNERSIQQAKHAMDYRFTELLNLLNE